MARIAEDKMALCEVFGLDPKKIGELHLSVTSRDPWITMKIHYFADEDQGRTLRSILDHYELSPKSLRLADELQQGDTDGPRDPGVEITPGLLALWDKIKAKYGRWKGRHDQLKTLSS